MAAQGGILEGRNYCATVVKAASAGNWNGRAINQRGVLPQSGGLDAIGIVMNPNGHAINDHLTVAYMGELKYKNSGAAVLSAGAFITINASGEAIVAAAGQYIVGHNLGKTGAPEPTTGNVGSNFYGVGLFNFPSRWFAPNSALAVSYYG